MLKIEGTKSNCKYLVLEGKRIGELDDDHRKIRLYSHDHENDIKKLLVEYCINNMFENEHFHDNYFVDVDEEENL